ncbi:phenazine biosynthesis protein PhzF [Pokkaliibacter plantistimulans]|uniref:Phenazine biosynthesis protein PhzF n=1 Tax=Proteobacteria bacterium 228 TaxID=2083153 RepID=A0A2S5KK22_9PROT|nr:PhzF family phenazine biosynthesis protein [Pokkaliibacter plantistimulans]PPC75151.1 phenazine biosynthesis protein PhzF [Pokkaliibacter plantistimulans]
MELNITVVDAFTDCLFKGNPAAVLLLEEWLDEALMQSIAAENNLSETAFVKRLAEDHFHIRWFSPVDEVAFCGHATLASAFVIFSEQPQLSRIRVYAAAVGELIVSRQDNGYLQMSFPQRPPVALDQAPAALLAMLSVAPRAVLRSEQAYFAIYDDEAEIRGMSYDRQQLAALAPYDVVITAPGKEYDFVCRYFWPDTGEDPVTGSIYAGLAPYWSALLNKTELTACQASRRGGVLHCRVAEGRVFVSGQAVRYLRGVIEV